MRLALSPGPAAPHMLGDLWACHMTSPSLFPLNKMYIKSKARNNEREIIAQYLNIESVQYSVSGSTEGAAENARTNVIKKAKVLCFN